MCTGVSGAEQGGDTQYIASTQSEPAAHNQAADCFGVNDFAGTKKFFDLRFGEYTGVDNLILFTAGRNRRELFGRKQEYFFRRIARHRIDCAESGNFSGGIAGLFLYFPPGAGYR